MIRGALATASVGTIVAGLIATGHHLHPHARSAPGGSAPTPAPTVSPTRAARFHIRPPLPRVNTSPSSEGTPRPAVHRRARPARSSGTLLDVTAYCGTGNRTASGQWPQLGMAAGNRWPFGTRLHIAGYGTVTVEDRIGWGSDVDLYFGSGPDCEQRASNFGRQHLRVAVAS